MAPADVAQVAHYKVYIGMDNYGNTKSQVGTSVAVGTLVLQIVRFGFCCDYCHCCWLLLRFVFCNFCDLGHLGRNQCLDSCS